jgi:hypothetical protein
MSNFVYNLIENYREPKTNISLQPPESDFFNTLNSKQKEYYIKNYRPNICSHVLLWPEEMLFNRCILTDGKINDAIDKYKKKGDTLLAAYALANRLKMMEVMDSNKN